MKRKAEAGIESRETCINLENLHMLYGILFIVKVVVDNKLSIACFSIYLAIY